MITEYMSYREVREHFGLPHTPAGDRALDKLINMHHFGNRYNPETKRYEDSGHYKHPRRKNIHVHRNNHILFGDLIRSLSECVECMGQFSKVLAEAEEYEYVTAPAHWRAQGWGEYKPREPR